MTNPDATARAVAVAAGRSRKPLLAAWMGGPQVADGVRLLNLAGVPTYRTPEHAVRSFMYLVSYARNLEILYETPRDIPVAFTLERQEFRASFDTLVASSHDLLTEDVSKSILETYGIPVVRSYPAPSADEAVETAGRVGYPVVLKVLSPEITHKTDVGGVALNLTSDADVRTAFARIIATARQARPDASVQGVTVQRMVQAAGSVELILGAKKDPVFGSIMMVGMGGVATEVLRDRSLGLPPLNERLARRMLESLRSRPLLEGYRGRPAVNLDRLIETMMRLSYLVADYPEIGELDINPLLVTPHDVAALDARVVLDRAALAEPPQRYGHLAIHPYPEEYVRSARLDDGTPVVLRPIRPEDEPLWHQLLADCSQQSLWFRFRYLFKEATHEMASRFCYIDYAREQAIVAEIQFGEARRLIGVGRLVADPDQAQAEYAVLVIDAYQGRGLGSLLTDFCLKIARAWQLKRVYGETTPDNTRMISTFRKWGFDLDYHRQPDVVVASKVIDQDH